jgi:hypothetical protein
MGTDDRIYFARRAAEEQELARSAIDPAAAKTHRKLLKAYLERASVGDRDRQNDPPNGPAES